MLWLCQRAEKKKGYNYPLLMNGLIEQILKNGKDGECYGI